VPGDTLVIVTARNEGERIGATLAALAVAFPGAPLLLADDGSTDATAAIAWLLRTRKRCWTKPRRHGRRFSGSPVTG